MNMTDDGYGDKDDPPFKRLCARYGLAMYFVQVLEHGIVNALVWLDLYKKTSGRWTPEEHDRYYDSRFAETLKELSNRLAKHSSIPSNLQDRLVEANKRRRVLAHHFFRESADAVALDQVEPLIKQLEDDRSFFQETDALLQEFMEPLLQRVGFTEEVREQAMRSYREEISKHGSQIK
ncbi:MAG: hypothetical protein EPN56_02460 [Rhodanobacter sp.]|nr:MAG: hypothetical protein EPN78_05960 [Rhodanobacter sp.]TAM14657.1 MAG: hypothetical protein EPN66_02225 [Rhodanobacter sp.]TAM37449.1 MAG: hypothetical protein EPN56_02460 [Rhodanobacter sp.]